MLAPVWWNQVTVRFAIALVSCGLNAGAATIAPSTFYTVSNEVIYTNQSTGQSTWQVSDLCTPFAPLCTCEVATSLCQGVLFDGDTASANNGSTDLHKFWAFNGSSNGSVQVIVSSNTHVAEIVLYFYNSPEELIGFPDIAITSPDADNLSFSFTDNDDLSQTDSQVRNVTVFLASSVIEFTIRFLFPSSNMIQYMLISEMELMNTGTSPTLDPVGFLNGLSSEVVLGADNPQPSVSLSCTVINSGSFEWQWKHNGSPVDTSLSKIWIADATRTSILVLDRLRYTDSGNYTCDVLHSTMMSTATYSRNINLTLEAKIVVGSDLMVTVTQGEMVFLKCEAFGYISEIVWLKNDEQLMDGSPHPITVSAGNGFTQNGGENLATSMISTVTIGQAGAEDAGMYTCRMDGVALQETFELIVNVIESSSSTATADVPETSSQGIENPTALPTSTMPATTDPVALPTSDAPTTAPRSNFNEIIIAVVVVLLVIAIIVIVILIVVLFAFKRRSFKSLNFTGYDVTSKEVLAAQAEEPFYAEIEKSDKHAPIIAAYAEIDTRISSPPPNTMEMTQFNGGPEYQEIPEHHPKPAKLRGTPSFLKTNPMYSSAEELDRYTPDNQIDVGSQFDIYAKPSTAPPPVPPYRGSPLLDHDEELSPTMFHSQPSIETDSDQLPPYSSIYSDPMPIYKSDVLEVTESNIRELKELGVGQFGEVVLAHTVGLSLHDLKISKQASDSNVSILVAIKKLRSDADDSEKEAFEKEVKFMARLHHENVVRFLGVCLSRNAFIMMEYMENGDLNQYLSDCELVSDDVTPLPPKTLNIPVLIYMCYQIAGGMRYLSSLNFIHRDLATRNCLVGQKYVIKIADFGMSRSLYSSVYYRISGRAVLPLRWMATECFYGRFSEKSDVWAFGVTAWEIFTSCKMQPYENWSDQEVIDDAVKGKKRTCLPQPEGCPDEVFDVIQCCWEHDPNNRSTFEELHSLFAQIHAYSDLA